MATPGADGPNFASKSGLQMTSYASRPNQRGPSRPTGIRCQSRMVLSNDLGTSRGHQAEPRRQAQRAKAEKVGWSIEGPPRPLWTMAIRAASHSNRRAFRAYRPILASPRPAGRRGGNTLRSVRRRRRRNAPDLRRRNSPWTRTTRSSWRTSSSAAASPAIPPPSTIASTCRITLHLPQRRGRPATI